MKLLYVLFFLAFALGCNACSGNCCYTTIRFYCCRCENKTETNETTTIPTPTIVSNVVTTQPTIVPITRTSINTVTVNVRNEQKLVNEVGLSNAISNRNHVYAPISIHSSNLNSYTFKVEEGVTNPTERRDSGGNTTTRRTTAKTTATTAKTTGTTAKTVDVCCVVIRPCYYAGCRTTLDVCGSRCIAPVVYIPYNPCPSDGCARRAVWGRTRCASRSCHYVNTDCSTCPSDFYGAYASFMRCYGCFSYGAGFGGGYIY